MRTRGDQLMMEDQYAVDSIRPKCMELQRMCEQYKELLRRRRQLLTKSHDLHDRLDRTNQWCQQGVDILASQPLERCQTPQGAEQALKEIDTFLLTAKDLKLSNPREFRQLFDDLMTPDTRAQAQQILKRMDDVQMMCEKRKESLRKIMDPRLRPVQHVIPAPVVQVTTSPSLEVDLVSEQKRKSSTEELGKKSSVFLEKSARLRPEICQPAPPDSGSRCGSIAASDGSSDVNMGSESMQRTSLSSMSTSSFPECDVLLAKRRQVMNELIETEKTYVMELQEIYLGYYKEIDSRAMQHLIPKELIGRKQDLFGNLEQIYNFHHDHFLQELQACRDYPAKVGNCFLNRREEFQMYTLYCQNKPKSEALRMSVGDSNPFFKECQSKLGHKLPLGAYLLKPVQRITKYQLLLKEMLRFTGDDRELETVLQKAVDTMLSIVQSLNANMQRFTIVGFSENLSDQGRLLIDGSFSVWTEHKRERIKDLRFKAMQRHVFLYERSMILAKKKEENDDEPVYTFKNKLKLSQVGLTEHVKRDKRKFELWTRGREEVFIIQAPSLEVKDIWVKEIKRVLMSQFDQIKSHRKSQIPLGHEEQGSSSQLSSDSSDYSLDNWRPTTPQNNNNTSTVPIGLQMVSPLTSPNNPPYSHPLPPTQLLESGGDEDGEDDEEGWSSGEFSNDDENTQENSAPGFEPSFKQQFVSLGDYVGMDKSELGLKEGDIVEILRVGGNGWWFGRHITTGDEGWVPSTYLEIVPPHHHSSHSSSESLSIPSKQELSHSRSSLGSPYYLSSPVSETTV